MKRQIHISPWMIIGISLVLIAVVGFLGVVNYNRDKEQMGALLKEKGAALIRSFEAGTRTGMMGMMANSYLPSGEAHLRILLKETADQPDISYIIIVDRSGEILAHNDVARIGKRFEDPGVLGALSPSDQPEWRIVRHKGGRKYFEVYKTFLPLFEHPGHLHRPGGTDAAKDKIFRRGTRPFIFIGMDISPFEAAMEEDFRHNLVMAAIIFSLGLAGVISLFWAQNYTRSRKLLEDTRKLASEVVSNLPVGILVMNADYAVIYSNELAWDLLGTDRSLGRDARTFLPGHMLALHERVKAGKQMAEQEILLRSEDETPVPAAISAADIHGRDGTYIGFLFVIKDLTELRALEARTQRVEKLAAIGNMAAGIAHEIRNPLSSIKGYVTFFGSLFDADSENRKAAGLMAEEVDRVNRVITELLEFAKPSDLKLEKTDLNAVIAHSLKIVAHDAEAAKVGIVVKVPDSLPKADADADRLSQVLLNLYLNAFQAMPGGGELTVRARAESGAVIIEVLDTGTGIDPALVQQIFDPYFTTKSTGTGLGLAIAHKIIENHGGYIRARPGEGRGTCMVITLPAEKDAS